MGSSCCSCLTTMCDQNEIISDRTIPKQNHPRPEQNDDGSEIIQNVQRIYIPNKKGYLDGYCLKCNEKHENFILPEMDYGINSSVTLFETKTKCRKCNVFLCDEETKKGILEEKYIKQLKKLKLNIQTSQYQLQQCRQSSCTFTYIENQNKHSYNHICKYCPCSEFSSKSSFNDEETNNSKPLNLENKTVITLNCQHQYYYEDLKEKVLKDLSFKCRCGAKLNDKYFKEVNQEEFKQFKNILFRRQLRALKNNCIDLQIVQCQQNCGHFWFFDPNYIIPQIKCQCKFLQKKVDKNKCFQCEKQIFNKSITFFTCDHTYHITCALEIIQQNRFKSKCKCKSKLIDIDFQRLGIFCKVCQKADGNLIPLKCLHYIHQTCYEEKGLRLQNFTCCRESIQDLVKQEWFPDKIINENCCNCNQKGEGLIKLDCDHWLDKKCFYMLLEKIQKGGSNLCICKKPIPIDILVSVD